MVIAVREELECVLALCFAPFFITPALSARAAGPMDVYAVEESNKIGVLKYSQNRHFATADNIENMRKVMHNHSDMPDLATLEGA